MAVAPRVPLAAERFGPRVARHVAVGDLERTPVDEAVAERPAEEAVMRVDLREPLGEALLDRGDPLRRYHSALAHLARGSSTAAALRRIPAAPGRANGVSPY